MSVFSEQAFEKKLLGLKDSQESISTLSDWCLQHKQHHKKIVAAWLTVLKKVRVENRLTLFYLANDVIQYSKRKNYDFVESWGTALQKATTMVRHDKVMDRILRIFKIWGDRGVYSEEFLIDLRGLLTVKKATPATPKQAEQQTFSTTPTTSSGEFVPSNLFSRIGQCKELEDDTDLKLKSVNECKLINLNDLDAFRTMLKDRKHAGNVAEELDEAIGHVEKYKKALEVEILERKAVIDLLQQATKFYETEKSDAKVVFNAYRNFGSRVKSLKRKLDELIPTLLSPVPSPDVNAPSPSPDSDIDLPNDEDLTGIVECLGGIVETDSDDDLMSIISYHSSEEEYSRYSFYELLKLPDHMRRSSLPLPDPSFSDSDLTELDDSFEDIEESKKQRSHSAKIHPKSNLCTALKAPIPGVKIPPVMEHQTSSSQSLVSSSVTFSKPNLCNDNGGELSVKEMPTPLPNCNEITTEKISTLNGPLCHSPNTSNADSNVSQKTNTETNLKMDEGFISVPNGSVFELSSDFLPSDEDLTGFLECLENGLLTSIEKSS